MSLANTLFLVLVLPFGVSLLDGASMTGAPGTKILGIKMIVRSVNGGMSSEQTLYVAADRERFEFRNSTGGATAPGAPMVMRYGPPLAAITRCDLGRSFELNLDANQYVVAPYPPKPLSQAEIEARGLNAPKRPASDKPTLRIKTTTVDTGERRDIFGHAARHVITTTSQTPLPGSNSQPLQTVRDGWYIDLDTRISCDRRSPAGKGVVTSRVTIGGVPSETREFVEEGKPERGYPLEVKTTSRYILLLPDGNKQERTSISETHVSLLEEGPLDASLFDIPPGFRQVEYIERNPARDSASGWSVAWNQFKTKISRLFQ